jgi:hypothetical protein
MDSEPLCAASAIHDLASYLDQRDLDDCDKDSLLGDDPILWFTMMLMPTGPTAVKLVAMTDCNNADEEKISISKSLVV